MLRDRYKPHKSYDYFAVSEIISEGFSLTHIRGLAQNRSRDWGPTIQVFRRVTESSLFAWGFLMNQSFLLPAEVDAITRIGDLTRWRLEKRGRFPRRLKIANRKIAWRKSGIEAWVADPEGWPMRQQGESGV
jgi:predicted DNA-binding transcriptional regulator AlpA